MDDWIVQTGQLPPDNDSERWVSYSIDDLYPEWQKKAHCQGVGVEYYFGDDGDQPTMSIKQVRQASKLCEVCPVFVDCLRWALTAREEYGVWAGTSGRVRRRIFKLMDNGLTTVDEVVERYCNGEGDTYRVPLEEAHSSTALEALGSEPRAVDEGTRGLRAVAGGEVAL